MRSFVILEARPFSYNTIGLAVVLLTVPGTNGPWDKRSVGQGVPGTRSPWDKRSLGPWDKRSLGQTVAGKNVTDGPWDKQSL